MISIYCLVQKTEQDTVIIGKDGEREQAEQK